MEYSNNLNLPFIMPSQAQKHVTHNEAISLLDAVVQLSVKQRGMQAMPSSTVEGSSYLIASSATGEWEQHAGSLAYFQDGAWQYAIPKMGWLAWIEDEKRFVVFTQEGWVGLGKFVLSENNSGSVFNLLLDAGRFAGTPEPKTVSVSNFQAPDYLKPANGAQFSSTMKFYHDNATFGGNSSPLSSQVTALTNKLKAPNNRRFGSEYNVMTIQCGAGTVYGSNIGGVNRYSPFTNNASALWPDFTCCINVACESGSLAVEVSPSSYTLFVDGVEVHQNFIITSSDGWKQITWVYQNSIYDDRDYNLRIWPVLAEPNSEFYIALPFLVASAIEPKPDKLVGILAGHQGW